MQEDKKDAELLEQNEWVDKIEETGDHFEEDEQSEHHK